jgi:hypothetical protein
MSAPDDREALLSLLRDALDTEEFNAVRAMIDALIADPGAPATDRKSAADSRYTGDSTMIVRGPTSQQAAVRECQKIRRLEQETGIVGMDSAVAIHRAAIRQMTGQSAADLPPAAARALYAALRNMPRGKARRMAADSAALDRRNQMFPHAGRLV